MSLVSLIDFVSFLFFGSALICLARCETGSIGKESRTLLGICLSLHAFVGLSNVLEHAGITNVLYLFEDYAELLFLPFFAYFIYSVGSHEELKRRVRSEEALRRSESLYRTLVENIDLGITLIDDSHRIVMINEAQGRFFGRAPEDFVGKPCFREFEQRNEVCAHCPGVRAMESGRRSTAESEGVRADGTRSPVRIQAFPLFEPDGRAKGYIEVVEDITERKKADETLREAEERFRALAEAAFEGIALTEKGRFLEVSDDFALIFGYTPPELVGRSVGDVVAPEVWEDVRQKILSGYDRPYETVCVKKDGSRFPVEVCGKSIRYRGRPARITALRDITESQRAEEERRKLETQLQHAQKLESLGVLTGGIAHDFNNLLMGILGNADLALLKLPPESPARPYTERIVAGAERAADLTSQMLAYSGRGQFVVAPVNLSSLVAEIVHLLETVVSKNAVLKLDLAPEIPDVEADPTQLRQVVMNLITNASDAIGEKSGVITVKTGVLEADRSYFSDAYLDEDLPEGCYAYVEVADTGSGMDQETQSKIFDPFFTTKFIGRGLGLAAVLGIVRGHRGALKVQSEPGVGTTIDVLLPCAESAAVSRSERAQRHVPADAGGPCGGTVLVVDDEKTVLTVAKMMLEEHGCAVLTASHGGEALEVFRQKADEISLVLLDMTMPHMSGEETFRELRKIRPEIRVILSSGHSEQEAESRFAGNGPAGFLHKPYRSDALTEKIREVLGSTPGESDP